MALERDRDFRRGHVLHVLRRLRTPPEFHAYRGMAIRIIVRWEIPSVDFPRCENFRVSVRIIRHLWNPHLWNVVVRSLAHPLRIFRGFSVLHQSHIFKMNAAPVPMASSGVSFVLFFAVKRISLPEPRSRIAAPRRHDPQTHPRFRRRHVPLSRRPRSNEHSAWNVESDVCPIPEGLPLQRLIRETRQNNDLRRGRAL